MNERRPPAPQLFGAALPPRLLWSRAGRGSRRAALGRMSGGFLALLVTLVVWNPLAEDDARALPFAHARSTLAAAAAVVRDIVPGPALVAAPEALPYRVVEQLALGEASFYARMLEGRRTASGETYRGAGMTAAHRTLPFGSLLRVTNVRNGRSVVVRVNDRGPFHARRVLDLSRAAARELGMLDRGRAKVKVELVETMGAP